MSPANDHCPAQKTLAVFGNVESGTLAGLVASLARAQGHRVVCNEISNAIDLRVVEDEDLAPSDLDDGIPTIAIADRRFRDAEIRALRRAGFDRVVDGDGSILDLAFAVADLLFDSVAEQKRYAQSHGGVWVRFRADDRSGVTGRIMGMARSGAYVACDGPPPEAAAVVLELALDEHQVSFRGRVAFTCPQGFGLEFALDGTDAPVRLGRLLGASQDRNAPASGPRLRPISA